MLGFCKSMGWMNVDLGGVTNRETPGLNMWVPESLLGLTPENLRGHWRARIHPFIPEISW